MRISKIIISNFRGFPGEYQFELGEPGKNMVVYGENGSGKSSLFHAIDQFLRASLDKQDITRHRNIFLQTSDSFVKLDIVGFTESGDRMAGSGIYEWSVEADPQHQSLIEESAKTRGCLDYKALLQTHFVHLKTDYVDIYELLIGSLLVHYQNPITGRLFGEEWQLIRDRRHNKLTPREKDELLRTIETFNKGLQAVIHDLTNKANELLSDFGYNVKIELDLASLARVTFRPKTFFHPQVHLKVHYAGQPVAAHHRFLNEARLSAIAIVIYFASLLIIPSSRLKIIILDDVLIGLDMSNRIPVFNILKRHFADWQAIILTYDRVWFDILRFQTQRDTWCYYEMYCEKDLEQGYDRPYSRAINNEGWEHLLGRARYHLEQHDERAAAVYARAAFEHKIKKYCEKNRVRVQYASDHSKVQSEWLWQAIKDKLDADNRMTSVISIIRNLETYRRVVLNPFSHETATPVVRAEIEEAINAVEALGGL